VFNSRGVGFKLLHQAFKDFISMKVLVLWVQLQLGHHQCCNSPILVEL
jgi:hypothetical protein